MARVRFTRHLARFFPDLPDEVAVTAATVADVVGELDRRFPGLAGYLVDEHRALRQHVNVFLGETPVRDRARLSDPVEGDTRIFFMQALSGG